MASDRLAELQTLDLTYADVGATAGPLPAGYHHLEVSRAIGHGRDWFDAAAERLRTWEVQRRSGLEVVAESEVAVGVRAVVQIGLGPVRLHAPVEVVAVIDEADRAGFAYGTLRGHPESGEERFEVAIEPDGTVTGSVRAFSVGGRWFMTLAGPVGRVLQRAMAGRYLDALTQPRATGGR